MCKEKQVEDQRVTTCDYAEGFPVPTVAPRHFHPIHPVVYNIGAGGSGKTYQNMADYSEAVLLLPTNEAVSKKRIEFPNRIIMTYHKAIGLGCEAWLDSHPEIVCCLLDEETQVEPSAIDKLIKKVPFVILMGDRHPSGYSYQCGDDVSRPITYPVISSTTDYRSKDDATRAWKSNVRLQYDKDMALTTDPSRTKWNTRYQLQSFPNPKVSTYNPADGRSPIVGGLILTNSVWLCNHYNSKATSDSEYVEMKSSLTFEKVVYHKAIYKRSELPANFPSHKYKSILASTTFRCQGKTLTERYQIDVTTMDWACLFTAISRCQSLDQITLIDHCERSLQDERWIARDHYQRKAIYSACLIEMKILFRLDDYIKNCAKK